MGFFDSLFFGLVNILTTTFTIIVVEMYVKEPMRKKIVDIQTELDRQKKLLESKILK